MRLTIIVLLALLLPIGGVGLAGQAAPPAQLQPLPAGTRVSVDPASVRVNDGDTVTIRWPRGNTEIVRVLGIDAPETRHLEHDIPFAQPWGREAEAFARGAIATTGRIALVRAETRDAYGRTLGYLFLDDANYSVLIVEARLAYETVSAFGDNGLPAEAAAVTAAAERAGPLPFEPPHVYRARLRKVAAWMKAQGLYPKQ